MLDKTITYRWHLKSLCKKLISHIVLLGLLAGLGWSAGATMLRTATWELVHSTTEYCALVWWRSAHTHLIDPVINDTLWIVTGCLCPTAADNLLLLTGIQPAVLCRKRATLSLANRVMDPGPLLHSALTCPPGGHVRHVKSKHPFVPVTQQLISSSDDNNRSAALRHITDEMRSSRRALWDSIFSSLTSAPSLLEWPAKNSVGLA